MSGTNIHESQEAYGGLALGFAQQGLATSIRESIALNGRFSFSFSTRDIKPLDSELCIVSFEWNVLHSVWLGRFSAETPTGHRRLTFDNHVLLEDLHLPKSDPPNDIDDPIKLAFGIGADRLTPPDWNELIG